MANAFEHIGEILEDMGDTNNAEKAYRAAIALQPGYDIYILNYAGFPSEHGKPQDARRLYEALGRGTGAIAETAKRCAGSLPLDDRAQGESKATFASLSDIKFDISETEIRDLLEAGSGS